MERGSDVHSPRLDDEMQRETESLTRGEPIEARAEEFRAMEDAADGEPPIEPIIASSEEPVPGALPHEAVRERSELARHLRGSIFPADRDAVVACAMEEHAPSAMVDALRTLPDETFVNVEAVWEALGGQREQRTHDDPAAAEPRTAAAEPRTADADADTDTDQPTDQTAAVEQFSFRFDLAHRLAAAPFLVSPGSTSVVIDHDRGVLVAQFGPWRVETSLVNVAYATSTGPYHPVKTIGPPHLSLSDRGLTFATNDREGLCIQFHVPVRGIDPLGLVRHPALTVTVDDVAGLRAALAR